MGQFYVYLHVVNTIDRNFSPTTLIASLISITVENVATVQEVLTIITTSDHFPLLQTQSQTAGRDILKETSPVTSDVETG
jgi:hypothetical protein